jgi:hypothetical protein
MKNRCTARIMCTVQRTVKHPLNALVSFAYGF